MSKYLILPVILVTALFFAACTPVDTTEDVVAPTDEVVVVEVPGDIFSAVELISVGNAASFMVSGVSQEYEERVDGDGKAMNYSLGLVDGYVSLYLVPGELDELGNLEDEFDYYLEYKGDFYGPFTTKLADLQ